MFFIEFSPALETVAGLMMYYDGVIYLLLDHECWSKHNTSECSLSEWNYRFNSSETLIAGVPNISAVASIAKDPCPSAKCFSGAALAGVCTALTLCRMCRDVTPPRSQYLSSSPLEQH